MKKKRIEITVMVDEAATDSWPELVKEALSHLLSDPQAELEGIAPDVLESVKLVDENRWKVVVETLNDALEIR